MATGSPVVPDGVAEPREAPPLRVLVVEDNMADADFVREAFSGQPHELHHVIRIADALAYLAAHTTDLIVLDLSLPDASGLEGLRRLRQAFPEIPVVVLTGMNDEFLGMRAVQEGAEDYLLKSEITEHLIYRAAQYAVERHRSRAREAVLAVEEALLNETRTLMEIMRDPVVAIGRTGKIIEANEAALKVTGLQRDKLIGTDFPGCFTAPEKARERCQQLFVQGSFSDYPLTIRHQDGRLTDVLCNAAAYRDGRGKVLGALAVLRSMPASNSMPVHRARRVSSDPSEAAPLRVLLVEDNMADADFIREVFSDRPHQMHHVMRIADALACVAAQETDLILLDLSLPDASGLEGLRIIRDAVPGLPVVVLTGSPDDSLTTLALKEGAEDFLLKSEITEKLIHRTVRYAVERRCSREQEKQLAVEQAARAESERMNQAKDRFLAVLAHELRNPLAPLHFALEILQRPGAGESALKQARHSMRRQVTQLARLVDDLVDVGRINSNKLNLHTERISVARIVNAAVEAAMPELNKSGHELHVSAPSPDVHIVADGDRVIQVLTNLLNNAAKFTPAGGTISIGATLEPSEVLIHVRDTGVGFDPAASSYLFEMFYQERRVTPASGLGIGLALARQLVELHGGTISATSPGKGLGAEFLVRLPVGLASSAPEKATAPSSAPPTSCMRVLIVDDNEDAAHFVALYVKELGHEPRVAHDASAALAVAHEFQPQVALLDIGLPGMDGYELATQLRKAPFGRQLCLAALTGWGQTQDRHRAAEAGFDCYFTKPMQPVKLKEFLDSVSAGLVSGTPGA